MGSGLRKVLRCGAALLILPSSLAAACGNSKQEADPSPTHQEVPFVDESEFVATLSQRACSLLADCCDDDDTQAACISEIERTTFQPSGEQYDGAAAAACVDAYA